ncbi:rhotekin-2-like isoform X2 [Dendronephthya gigantea]|uniref:rhotekin-2-like isoform X2 n=1 Tax=Dendronephthya gigantea TaxID=151771 RepID=UPI00106CCB79|nr:rhotekin-2-like isoform X2 [Dendronephthya gigantea]
MPAGFTKVMEDTEIQEKINYEVKMREGTVKLLEACHEQSQALEGAKNLLTINARIIALMSLLQRNRKQTMNSKTRPNISKIHSGEKLLIPCQGKVSISDIRVPLMWNEEEHFRAKESISEISRIYHVFCILKLGGQVAETGLVEVDQSSTDVTLDDVVAFDNVDPDFKLNIEIYYTTTSTNDLHSGHKKHVHRSNSDGSYGPKYVLAGHASLGVDDVDDSIKIHDIKKGAVGASPTASAVTADDSHTANLPLWSQFCCRLAAVPQSNESNVTEGVLFLQSMTHRKPSWTRYWCRLRKAEMEFWDCGEDAKEGKAKHVINLNKGMEVDVHLQGNCEYDHIIILTCSDDEKEPVFACECEQDFVRWKKDLRQSLVDLRAWKQAYECDITLTDPTPKKLPVFSRISLYDQIDVEIMVEDDIDEEPTKAE